jgi:hypothetical protein
MANTDITSRTQFERTDLRAGGEGIRRGSEKGAAIYSAIAAVIAIALCITAVMVIESWAQWLVLAVIIVTTVGIMIALSPNRRGA